MILLFCLRKGTRYVNIIISNSNGMPIYEQITTQIKNMILCGSITEGDGLPSMRLLAKELRISVITTKRAYEELEKEGFIVSVPGKGSFVAGKNIELIREEQLKKVEEMMQNIVESASVYGIELNELIEMLTLLYKGDQ